MMSSSLYLGLMSGTSLDGVDAVLADFASARPTVLACVSLPYPDSLRSAVLALQPRGDNELDRAARLGRELAQLYAQAVHATLAAAGVSANQVAALGCHGQTVRHAPHAGYTIQLGDLALLAELTGVDTIGDFRRRDLAAGGQGAPLVPAAHQAWFAHPTEARAVLNLGGIGNLTRLDPALPVMGFDTGPGNMLLDAWIGQHQPGQRFDANGEWAASGQCLPALLAELLTEPYFACPPPKSTGRDLFSLDWLQPRLAAHPGLAAADVQRTLLALTVHSVADAVRQHAPATRAVYVCGGGALNPLLMAELATALPDCAVAATDALGIPAMQVEALAFAWLARQYCLRQPGNVPAVTGAQGERVLGALYPR